MKTLLVINDDELLLDAIAEIFELEGYHVWKAKTGIEGLGIALHERPNIILCDLSIGGLGGYAVYDILQADYRTSPIPFILMTGWCGSVDTINWRQIPNNRVIAKPFPIETLLTTVLQITESTAATA